MSPQDPWCYQFLVQDQQLIGNLSEGNPRTTIWADRLNRGKYEWLNEFLNNQRIGIIPLQ